MGQIIQVNSIKRRAWLLPVWGGLLWCVPVDAAQLESWRFDQSQNQLQFTTDQAVSPRVQLIPDPTRLVVDLPGIVLSRPTVNQNVGVTVRSVRVGQFDNQTARIVVELAPGYVVDPAQVKVQGDSPTNWSIQLPEPQPWEPGSTLLPNQPEPLSSSNPSTVIKTIEPKSSVQEDADTEDRTTVTTAAPLITATKTENPDVKTDATVIAANLTAIRDLVVTQDGFFLKTTGANPDVKIRNSRDNRTVSLEVSNAAFTEELRQKVFSTTYHGVESITLQDGPKARMVSITLKVDPASRGWRASVSRGIILSPKRRIASSQLPRSTTSLVPRTQPQRPTYAADRGGLATINSIDLGGNQLLIRASGRLSYTQGWEGSTYRVTIRGAQLAQGIRTPQVGYGSYLSNIRVLQQDPTTVTILASPASGVRVRGVQQLDTQSLLVQLARAGETAPIPRTIGSSSISQSPSTPLPRVQGQPVVMIDPGHGGKDPGAIGIGGLRETDVVLEMSTQVAQLLQQAGVAVRMTRRDETFVSLQGRVDYAESARANLFVSIHANAISLSRPDINGLETFHAPGASAGSVLARTIHNTILRNISMGSRGVKAARFYVIRKSSMPSVLVETGFLTGAEDNARLRNPAWRSRMAQSIAQGILNYLAGRYN
ncbi:MAG: N-acetylmuramoyl-L-alanine amidase [Thermosynechococcaceae cyanobacterium]